MAASVQKVLQYKQIDFLRLFRLCRNLNIVRRKRKMPTQYERTSHINSSCSKLFKTFLTGAFPDNDIRVDGRRQIYTIPIPVEVSERLMFLSLHLQVIQNHDEYAPVCAKMLDLNSNDFNFITDPAAGGYRHLMIRTTPSVGGRRANVLAGASTSTYVSRPPEEYFRCAKECLAYKEKWNEHVGDLCNFVDEERSNIERIAEQERLERISAAERQRVEDARGVSELLEEQRRVAAARVEQERAEMLRSREALRNVVEERTRNSRQQSQQLFNQALNARRRTTNGTR